MSVQAHHINFFSPHSISNRYCVKFEHNMNADEFSAGEVPLITGESLAVDPLGTKRPRESDEFRDSAVQFASPIKRRYVAFDSSSPSLIDAEIVSQIQNQQQSEINRLVAQKTEKLRIEIKARHSAQTRMLASAIQNTIAKKLKNLDDEIIRIRNLNWMLQERVKNLYVENQIWRDIAQTNEATANNLRTNLDQVLAQIKTVTIAVEDDAQSSCGSSSGEGISGGCKRCGEREASVLVLPCRHLCLCTVCGSVLLRTCPVCDSVMNASVHVNMSS